ncbi:MAG: alkyl/aryl-sulfatase [Phycisphaerae bacterium]|nr:alkyl/aryl-sulfatase [Phycisphaerae bacterium]
MKLKKTKTITIVLLLLLVTFAPAIAEDTPATKLLKARTAEFDTEIIKVTDNIYTAIGYSVSAVSMVIGTDGIIIIDTGMDTISAKEVLADFRKITTKPVKAIILTHSHGDHTGGIPVFSADTNPQIWACENFGSETEPLAKAGLTIQNKRGARQGGFMLPPEKRINNGVAKAYWPKRGGDVFKTAKNLKPTNTFNALRKKMNIAGVNIELVAIDGETTDALYVWLPDHKTLFAGDNFYKSWPNLYAIRGTMYRDILAWADSVDQMLNESPEFLVPGHTRPVIGKTKINDMMTDYRDAIRFVFDKTIEGMNKGLTPNELVEYVKLPERFANKDYLREYYGNTQWAVRQIFNAYLGWFDGNPTNLFPLLPKDEAQRIAQLAGGKGNLLSQARQAIQTADYQWAAQLADYLITLEPDASEPKLIKATALEHLAENILTATGRNYYLTCVQELRNAAGKTQANDKQKTSKQTQE